jgi:hypothetical protein
MAVVVIRRVVYMVVIGMRDVCEGEKKCTSRAVPIRKVDSC